VFDKPGEGSILKVIDFGFSKQEIKGLPPRVNALLVSPCGTEGYVGTFGAISFSNFLVAPEVINEDREAPYGLEIDLWSLGCVVFFALFCEEPFKGEDEDDLYQNIFTGTFSFPADKPLSYRGTLINLEVTHLGR
jgi:serine/threonine protein kinase